MIELSGSPVPNAFGWLKEAGLTDGELAGLNPCVPGEFTLTGTIYVNSGTPGIRYLGTAEATLPMVAGRWYLIPDSLVDRHPDLRRDARPVSQAPRLARG